jgi:hypothetical protein
MPGPATAGAAEPIPMNTALFAATVALLVAVLGLAFLVLGALRALGVLNWRLDQLEATRPSRLGREGIRPGRKAPDFTLESVAHGQVSLSDFLGRKVLLVFTQAGCGPWRGSAGSARCRPRRWSTRPT